MISQEQSQCSASKPLWRRPVTGNFREVTSESLSSSSTSSRAGTGAGFFLGEEISTQDYALSIEHILEQILSSLDRKTLFRCRLVSHKWRTVSTKLVKKDDRCYLIFKYSPSHHAYAQRWSWERIYSPKFTLPKLTSFLKTTYSDGDGDGDVRGSWSMDGFPSNTFSILCGTLDIPQLQSFLNQFGEHIQNLHLDFTTYPQPLDEPALMKSVETLLIDQAPNLRKLSLWANLQERNTEDHEDAGSNSDLGGLLSSDQSDSAESKDINLRKNNKLNKLTFEVPSRKILEKIISISPHLQDIKLNYARFHSLIEPVNRLHLLRKFKINANGDASFNFENIQMIENSLSRISQKERQTQNLPPTKFRKLCISFFGIAKLISESEERRLCFVGVINKILECSWDTLEYISLENYVGDTLRGIKWPAILPKVGKLVLRPTSACGLDVFPSHENFNIQDTFPKLKTLYFDVEATYFVSFSAVNYLRNRHLKPVPSAKFVHVNMLLSQIPHSRVLNFRTDVWLVREFHFLTNDVENLFPNAKTSLDVVPC